MRLWRAPRFWGEPPGLYAMALAPLSAIWGTFAAARLARPAPRAALPTIAIGGLTLGGDGKTPTALALAEILSALGERPAILSRGYGGASRRREPVVVNLARHNVFGVGDEALLLARAGLTIVGIDRARAGRLAKTLGASVLLLDDGLHGRRLEPDLAILVVDANYGAGDGFCPPSGPLRAPLAAQFACADIVLAVSSGAGEECFPRVVAELIPTLARLRSTADHRNHLRRGKPLLLRARLKPDPRVGSRLAGRRVFAFAGLGRPEKFLRSLDEIGADVEGFRWFPDHHVYTPDDLMALAREAKRRGASLVTTRKDAVRIGPHAPEALPVKLTFELPGAVETLLADFLAQARRVREDQVKTSPSRAKAHGPSQAGLRKSA